MNKFHFDHKWLLDSDFVGYVLINKSKALQSGLFFDWHINTDKQVFASINSSLIIPVTKIRRGWALKDDGK